MGEGAGALVGGRKVADRELDRVFARNDRGKYDAPAPTVRRDKDDLNGLHYILRNHMEDLSPTQREIIEETYFDEQSRDEIAARRGISLNTYDNHRKAACQKLRDSMMAVVDFSSEIDLPDLVRSRRGDEQAPRGQTAAPRFPQERRTFQLWRRPVQLRRRPFQPRRRPSQLSRRR